MKCQDIISVKRRRGKNILHFGWGIRKKGKKGEGERTFLNFGRGVRKKEDRDDKSSKNRGKKIS